MKRFLAGMLCMLLVFALLVGTFGAHFMLQYTEQRLKDELAMDAMKAALIPSFDLNEVTEIVVKYGEKVRATITDRETIDRLVRTYNEIISAEPFIIAKGDELSRFTPIGGGLISYTIKTENGEEIQYRNHFVNSNRAYHFASREQLDIRERFEMEGMLLLDREYILAKLRRTPARALWIGIGVGSAIYLITEEQSEALNVPVEWN